MKMLSSFTHPHVIPKLYEFLSYVEHKIRYCEEYQLDLTAIRIYFTRWLILMNSYDLTRTNSYDLC